jgi:hypothetical protein
MLDWKAPFPNVGFYQSLAWKLLVSNICVDSLTDRENVLCHMLCSGPTLERTPSVQVYGYRSETCFWKRWIQSSIRQDSAISSFWFFQTLDWAGQYTYMCVCVCVCVCVWTVQERPIFWEMIISVIVRKKVHIHMYLLLNGCWDSAIWSSRPNSLRSLFVGLNEKRSL